MLKSKSLPILAGAAALGAFIAATPAHASLMADGITYTLTETPVSTTEADFTLGISGINGPSDTEGGRSGVQSFAFGTSGINFVSASAPTGFTEMAGGLDSMGCNGNGAFFCFAANTTPPSTPALAANSSLSYAFDVTISSGNFGGFASSFKINWVGDKNNYDLVSEPLPAVVPAPLIGHGLLVLLAVGGVLFGGKLFESLKMRRSLAT
jgi:hypothetical protein